MSFKKQDAEGTGVLMGWDGSSGEMGEKRSNEEELSKRQKKLKHGKLAQKRREQAAYEEEKLRKLPMQGAEAISEHFATVIRAQNPDLSAIELDEMYLKKSEFLGTEAFDGVRNLHEFPGFMARFSRAPRAIVLSMSNIRVADVYRSLGGSSQCVKLFAKNKLHEDVATVESVLGADKDKKDKKDRKDKDSKKKIKYFVATPTRLEKLLESTELFFEGKDKLDIILDASYLDSKKNSLLDSENTKVLCKVLRTMLDKKSSVKVLLY
ncbi:uncharacterized protein HLK63_J01111 [Nakaseomyces glabratus]|nr:uncharacterized protein GW608_J01111 [Nakaseomyces glabratus]UCS26794.1 uncharacterized protein HLK63_J01111 [Nakaseomyces glabratus]UCS32023.1 uncharacterized protein HLK64_J01111 [Nakaseomyces glabratus]UCS37252.1 uncharacterized protein HLK62_J01111 [Nakaseomyces glabratus]